MKWSAHKHSFIFTNEKRRPDQRTAVAEISVEAAYRPFVSMSLIKSPTRQL
ncbi:MAG: hypothetical protein BWX84_01215 [Verrucomicrobia bacterium ADurb.Bin118]|nr:MAG: hypothetical protein BWX84_01215 [Verrucomicrobia bacterium ADurb.Bin118]